MRWGYTSRRKSTRRNSEGNEGKPWTGGIPPYEWIGEKIAPEFGDTYGKDILLIVEYYYHNPDTYDVEACYLYVPVQEV